MIVLGIDLDQMSKIFYAIILPAVEVIMYTFHVLILILLIAKRKSKFMGAFYNIFKLLMVADVMYFVLVSSQVFTKIFLTSFRYFLLQDFLTGAFWLIFMSPTFKSVLLHTLCYHT